MRLRRVLLHAEVRLNVMQAGRRADSTDASGALPEVCSLLSSICHVRVEPSLLKNAQHDTAAAADPLWFIAIDLTLVALSGLTKDSASGMAAFWRDHGAESNEAPIVGATTAIPTAVCQRLRAQRSFCGGTRLQLSS